MKSAQGPLHVVIATPLGKGGRGGIDRVMDEVRACLLEKPDANEERIRFAVTRGRLGAAFSIFRIFIVVGWIAVLRVRGVVDLVHINLSSHGSTWRKVVLAKACKALGIPYIIHLHGSRMREYWLNSPSILRGFINAMFIGASRIIVLGEVWKAFVVNQTPEVADRIIILPNATRAMAPTLIRSSAEVHILFLGRLGERKGVFQLVEALSMNASMPNWNAIIAGDGDVAGTRALAKKLGIEGRVLLPGWCEPSDVNHLLSSADILVLPSFDENLPMSVIEGMAAGLAIVATPVGATGEIIKDGVTGILVQPGDVQELADAIALLILNTGLREELGKSAREYHREHLEVVKYTARLRRIWREAVATP